MTPEQMHQTTEFVLTLSRLKAASENRRGVDLTADDVRALIFGYRIAVSKPKPASARTP